MKMQIKPPSSQAGRFTQILSIGIGGSSLGPQFVSEALAPDNPPLKVLSQVPQSVQCGFIAHAHSVGVFHATS
jgi:glucose-6-phosphate isomerase